MSVAVLLSPLMAQDGLAAVAENAGTPIEQPEPAKRVADEPGRIFQKLMSGSEEERKEAKRALRWDGAQFPKPFDGRLLLVNLDSDEEQEVILILSASFLGTVALVFDHREDGWWQVGSFGYSWHWNANQAERFIELREIVSYGRKDILVRITEGGTGIAETTLSIYRLSKGRLYRAFRTMEDGYRYVYGSGITVSDKRTIEYPESDSDARFLLVHHVSRTEPDEPSRSNPVREKKSCSVYRWEAREFTFKLDGGSGRKLCGGRD